GVEDAHARAPGRERQRQVDGRGRLPDAALARAHCDDVADPRQRLEIALDRVRRDSTGPGCRVGRPAEKCHWTWPPLGVGWPNSLRQCERRQDAAALRSTPKIY